MALDHFLRKHLAACEEAHQLMLEENRLLKAAAAPPDEEFLERKRLVLARLDETLEAVRQASQQAPEESAQQRPIIQQTQQLVFKALLLDRENEQLLLRTLATAKVAVPDVRPSLEKVQNLYRKHLSS